MIRSPRWLSRVVRSVYGWLGRKPIPEDGRRIREEYFELANQYYVAGRFSYHAHALPVAANLFHHAVELYIKGYLAKEGVDERERVRMGHDLKRLWKRLRRHAAEPLLDVHNVTIQSLNLFEELRYPEKPRQKYGSAEMTFGPKASGATRPPKRPRGAKPIGVFHCDIAEIDRLVIELHRLASMRPLKVRFSPGGVAELKRDNAHAGDWL